MAPRGAHFGHPEDLLETDRGPAPRAPRCLLRQHVRFQGRLWPLAGLGAHPQPVEQGCGLWPH
eukprot:11169404-Lingulodinium_polyedra.AAC.1